MDSNPKLYEIKKNTNINKEDEELYIKNLFESTIGNNISHNTPFGTTQIIYNDFTASGRGVNQIENFISKQVLPFYANVHSSCGYLAEQSEAFRNEAKSIVRRYCNTDEKNSIIFTGQGTTSCISKLIKLLTLNEYNEFYFLLEKLYNIYTKFQIKFGNDISLFEYINEVLILDIKEKYSKLFRLTNFCYSNRWGGFDCVLCRMGFTTESQYNDHAKNDIHIKNLNEFNLNKKSNENFIDDIANKYNIKQSTFIYDIMKDYIYFKPIVFLSIYEHNSNYLPWIETKSKIITIKDITELKSKLNEYKNYYIKMGSFTAASNITGKYLDVDNISILLHKYNALVFFDYASASPYIKMDMNLPLDNDYRTKLGFSKLDDNTNLSYKDALFFSPHKFLGGINTPGVLIIQQKCVRNLLIPSEPGGGVVLFVTEDTQNYIKNIESREESGTPDIVGGVRVGLSLLLREKISHYSILDIDEKINTKVINHFKHIPNLHILSDNIQEYSNNHIPIYSFLISFKGKFFHPNYISALLNDIFGIQSRPGCSCASLYGQYLLGINKDDLKVLETLTCNGKEIFRPGYTRLNFPYFYPEYIIDYVLYAIEYVSKYAYKFLPFYAFKIESGKFYHRKEEVRKKWLNDLIFENGNIIIPDFFEDSQKQFISKECIQNMKDNATKLVEDNNIQSMIKFIIGKSKMDLSLLFDVNDKYRWFLIYNDIESLLNSNTNVSDLYTQTLTVPFNLKEYSKDIKTNINTISQNNNIVVDDILNIELEEDSTIKPSKKNNHLFPKIPYKIINLVNQANKDFNMIQENDNILVGVSGGKDSLTLLHVLLYIQSKSKYKFKVGAVTVNPESEDYDPSPLIKYMKELNVPYYYESDCIMKNAKSKLIKNSICSFCARMKRGIIYNTARREGYNVIALGQHLDDLAESFLMSIFHNGLLRTMKANYLIDKGDLRVIRPLIYCREKLFKEFSLNVNLPVIQENCPACFSSPKERQRMKVLLAQEENLFPDIFSSLQKAMMPLLKGVLQDNKDDNNI